ncbi:MAG: type IV secretion system DNA-binding domain-containing protein, partial [Patescibacteria group bacterium]
MRNNEITFFAETNFRNQRKRFGIKIDDRRRHMYIIGQTGTGKTTLLMNMLVSDIMAGRGVGFIDPHGDMAEHLLNHTPKERIKDVIYFNPADMAHPIAFNAIEKVDPEARHLVASGLMGVFKKIWPDVWSARMEYILNNTVLALLEIPGSTLLGINRMFSDKAFRKSVVDQLSDPVIKAFWIQEYAKYQQRYEQEATAAIQNKIGQFSSAAIIRNIIGQPHSSFDFRKAMDERK